MRPNLHLPGSLVKRKHHNTANRDAVIPKQHPKVQPQAEVRSGKPQVQHKTNSEVKMREIIFLTPNYSTILFHIAKV